MKKYKIVMDNLIEVIQPWINKNPKVAVDLECTISKENKYLFDINVRPTYYFNENAALHMNENEAELRGLLVDFEEKNPDIITFLQSTNNYSYQKTIYGKEFKEED